MINSSVLSATPGACYAHVNERKNEAEIPRQLLRSLDRTVELGRAIRSTAERAGPDTLVLFTADLCHVMMAAYGWESAGDRRKLSGTGR